MEIDLKNIKSKKDLSNSSCAIVLLTKEYCKALRSFDVKVSYEMTLINQYNKPTLFLIDSNLDEFEINETLDKFRITKKFTHKVDFLDPNWSKKAEDSIIKIIDLMKGVEK